MADFILDGRTKVKTLKAQLKDNFGCTLRVYNTVDCKELADDEATLASIRAEGFSGGELSVKGNMKVATFEKRIAELYGIGVQIANADDTAFADDLATIATAKDTSSVSSGKAHLTTEELARRKKEGSTPAEGFEADSLESASAKIRVYGKAQNRTALGIAHAYMVMYPHATIEDLRKAFPNSLNPDKGVSENFIYAEENDTTGSGWNGYFAAEDEIITTGDGKKVIMAMLWT